MGGGGWGLVWKGTLGTGRMGMGWLDGVIDAIFLVILVVLGAEFGLLGWRWGIEVGLGLKLMVFGLEEFEELEE